MTFLLTVVTIVIGIPRVLGVKTVLYQAVAHLYVGSLFGAAIESWRSRYLVLAVALTILEIAWFLLGVAR